MFCKPKINSPHFEIYNDDILFDTFMVYFIFPSKSMLINVLSITKNASSLYFLAHHAVPFYISMILSIFFFSGSNINVSLVVLNNIFLSVSLNIN